MDLAHRMKAKVEHRVPSAAPIRELLETAEVGASLVFPAAIRRILCDMTFSALMKQLDRSDYGYFVDQRSQRAARPHGLRSTFSD